MIEQRMKKAQREHLIQLGYDYLKEDKMLKDKEARLRKLRDELYKKYCSARDKVYDEVQE